ncbi:MAG: 2,3-bisphosphoglycerate-independent phosphoglycerate mutase [archaeon]|jgi:2,3-bisphosphoglycerate-independent phosphoglycerate mutase
MPAKQKVIVVIRDGWGYRKETEFNMISNTPTPNTDKLMSAYPNTLLKSSGESVGLPKGYQGNSEVGHMTIGSGRIIFQSLERINYAIESGEFFKNKAFVSAIENAKKNNSSLHLIGLLQEEGVHSHLDHLLGLLDMCDKNKLTNVKIHVITDGRDAPVTKSLDYLKKLTEKLSELKFGEIATINGRFYAMDRDCRWERTRQAYECIVEGKTKVDFTSAVDSIKQSHKENITDEFIVPRKVKGYAGVNENDSIIFFNFRTDRTRQLTQAIVEKNFAGNGFEGWKVTPLKVCYVGMTQFYTPMNALVAFPDQSLKNLLGEVVANAGLTQLRISETEKYAHVTFFFNGQIEQPFKGEDRVLVPSPKVATYDLKPEMSAYEVSDKLVDAINSEKYDLIVTNLVNGDMVGHTGNLDAITTAVKTVDACVGKISEAGIKHNYSLLIFADHGNAEDKTMASRTSHTKNDVPFILVSENPKLKKAKLLSGLGLQDIAPTVLAVLGIKKPEEMTGTSIIEN